METQWRLPTARGEYVVSLSEDRAGLVLDHWGAAIPGPVPRWSEPERPYQHRLPADAMPLEYASAGHRHTGFSELLVDRGELGPTGARFQFVAARQENGRLEVDFADVPGALALTLTTVTAAEHDVVRRWVTITNTGAETVWLPRALSAAWSIPVGRTARVTGYAGSWSREFGLVPHEVRAGAWEVHNRTGVTGSESNPVVLVEALDRPARDAYGVALAWSGTWRMRAEAPPTGDLFRVSCGIDDDTTTVTLRPGERFVTPEALGVWSAAGPEGISDGWHDYQRSVLARDLDEPRRRPIVYNSWFATEFDVREDHQLELATVAAEIGAELFVVDDGWFVGRRTDREGLGDWTVDPEKFPSGLDGFARALADRGLRFGLWIEPESVNPTSALFAEHPEWIYRVEGRPLLTVRGQYVLDLGREEVAAWMEETLRRLLGSAPIDYLKWDMNRPVSDGGRPGDPLGRQWSVSHTRNYYRLLRMIRDEFAHVTVEGCAAGGARIDNAVLGLVDVVWTSDETGAADRLAINHGYLAAYPAHAMSTWVTDVAGLVDRSPHTLEYQFAVAMTGVLGIGSDVSRWSPQTRKRAAELVTLYRELRPVIHGGRVRRHGDPLAVPYAIEYRRGDDEPVVALVFDRDRDRRFDREPPRLRPALLDDARPYRLRGTDLTVSGAAARTIGVPIPFALAADADVLLFDPIG